MRRSWSARSSAAATVIGVGGLTAAVEVEDAVEDDLVRGPVEVGPLQDLHDVGDRVLGQQHAAEHGLLGGDVLRGLPVVRRSRRRGRLKSSATATGFLHLLRARPHHHSAGKSEFGGRRRTERLFGDCYRRAPTVRRLRGARRRHPAAAGEDVRKPEGSPSNTGVHADLHNLWTSRWMEACRHVETAGDSRCTSPGIPARHLRRRRPPAVDRRKVAKKFREPHHVSHDGAPEHASPGHNHRGPWSGATRPCPVPLPPGEPTVHGALRGAEGPVTRAVPERREGRRTGVRRPSRAVLGRASARRRPRSAAASRPRGAPARRRCADRWS